MDVITFALLEDIPVEYKDVVSVVETKVRIIEKTDGVDIVGFDGCRVNVRRPRC